MDSISVPFRIKYSTLGDLDWLKQLEKHSDALVLTATLAAESEVRGFARLERDAIVIEYRESATAVTGGTVSKHEADVRSFRIPLSAVQEISVRRSWLFQPRLVIEVNRMDAIPALKWCKGHDLVLPIAWRDRMRARELTVTTLNQLADRRLAQLGESEG